MELVVFCCAVLCKYKELVIISYIHSIPYIVNTKVPHIFSFGTTLKVKDFGFDTTGMLQILASRSPRCYYSYKKVTSCSRMLLVLPLEHRYMVHCYVPVPVHSRSMVRPVQTGRISTLKLPWHSYACINVLSYLQEAK